MSHDANGNELKVGDAVVIFGKVTQLLVSSDYCNCSVELDQLMPPENTKSVISSINTRQVEKVAI